MVERWGGVTIARYGVGSEGDGGSEGDEELVGIA